MTGYRPLVVAACPDCHSDLRDEGDRFWCPACRRWFTPQEAEFFDEGVLPGD